MLPTQSDKEPEYLWSTIPLRVLREHETCTLGPKQYDKYIDI